MKAIGAVAACVLISAASSPSSAESGVRWQALQPGLEHAVVIVPAHRDLPIDGQLHLVRIDPARAPLEAVMAGAGDGRARTAAEWCRDRKLAVAINMGMYREDKRTNSGYARAPGYVNNPRWAAKYKTALAFGSVGHGAPTVLMADLDDPGDKERLGAYGTVVQNLRLIRAPGRGVWGKQERRWSEAAVGMDKDQRIIFVFSRYPYSMKELTDALLALPLGVTSAMHVEGGPEASLSIHSGGVDLDLNGSYETGFNENDDEQRQWPIPNVLGVPRR
jgi:hypothetical protein